MRLFHGIAVGAAGFPTPGVVFAESSADDSHAVGDHEGGVETDAELTDNVEPVFGLVILFKSERTAFGNNAQITFQLFLRHADAGIGN